EGKALRPKDYWRTWGWVFSLVNLGGVAVLLATARRWLGSGEAESTIAAFAPPRRPGRTFAVLVMLAVLLGAGLAWPRLGQSLGEDEDQNLRQSIYGEWLPDGNGGYEEERVGPGEIMKFYPGPNNHVAHSLLAHASIRASQLFTGEPKRFASETAMRMPAFLAGLGTLVVVALLAWRIGHLEAGVFAAFILAIHPWWVQYASEARGYTLAMLLLVGSLLLMLQALHRGAWRSWLTYGVAQLFLLWTLPSLVFQVAVMNVVAALLIWRSHRGAPALLPQLKRWFVVNALGAMAFLQLMGPNLAQLGEYLERTRGTHAIGLRWVQHAVTHLFVGMPWRYPSTQGLDPIHAELSDVFQGSPVLLVALMSTTLLCVVSGIVRLLRENGIRPLLPVIFLLPPVLSVVVGRLEGANMYHWYLVYALPGLALFLAVGLEGAAQQLGKLVPPRAAAVGILAGFLGTFGLFSEPARVALQERSFRPSREAVELTRPLGDPVAQENERILTARLSDRKIVYDPRMLKVATLEELEALMGEADTAGKALYINSGRLFHNRRHRPEVFALLDDPLRFALVGELPGGTPPMGRAVWRYLGGSSEPGR
ncbi:MAG: glycosyltransferase family 39 protein, partial [Deltaproteobacteria bacterium]|nr:glycosyltransferase family 39 protein [Deltaproteobacteria bacterium]